MNPPESRCGVAVCGGAARREHWTGVERSAGRVRPAGRGVRSEWAKRARAILDSGIRCDAAARLVSGAHRRVYARAASARDTPLPSHAGGTLTPDGQQDPTAQRHRRPVGRQRRRQRRRPTSPSRAPRIYGENVFSPAVQKARLPKDVYKKLQATLDKGAALDPALADAVAKAMREWAMEKGATHYTHWFQPLTGLDRREARLLLQPGRRRHARSPSSPARS